MKTNSIFKITNFLSNMLLQAAGDNSSGSKKKEHIWHKKWVKSVGPYGEMYGYVECLFCRDPDHWGYVIGYIDENGHGQVDFDGDGYADNGYCECDDCVGYGGRGGDIYGNNGYDAYGDYGGYGDIYGDYGSGEGEKCKCSCHYDSHDEDGHDGYSTFNRIANLNSVIDPNLVCDKCGCTKNAGHEGEHNGSVCDICGSSACQRLRNKKKCSFDAFERERNYPYYNEEKMLDDMKDWSAKDENPMGGTIQRHMSYVEASGYKYEDGTYAVYVDSSNTTNGATHNITYVVDSVKGLYATHNGQRVTEYYHTHNDSSTPSTGNTDGRGDVELARELEEYGVKCYIVYRGTKYEI